jgi:hypothetical protein
MMTFKIKSIYALVHNIISISVEKVNSKTDNLDVRVVTFSGSIG